MPRPFFGTEHIRQLGDAGPIPNLMVVSETQGSTGMKTQKLEMAGKFPGNTLSCKIVMVISYSK